MAIRFTFDNQEYVCDTPHEAATLKRLLGRKRPGRRAKPAAAAAAGPRLVQASLTNIGAVSSVHTSNVLRALLEAPDGLSSDVLAAKLGLGLKSLPPIVGHLNSLLSSNNYVAATILERRTIYERGKAKSIYRLTDLGREVAPRLLAA